MIAISQPRPYVRTRPYVRALDHEVWARAARVLYIHVQYVSASTIHIHTTIII